MSIQLGYTLIRVNRNSVFKMYINIEIQVIVISIKPKIHATALFSL